MMIWQERLAEGREYEWGDGNGEILSHIIGGDSWLEQGNTHFTPFLPNRNNFLALPTNYFILFFDLLFVILSEIFNSVLLKLFPRVNS